MNDQKENQSFEHLKSTQYFGYFYYLILMLKTNKQTKTTAAMNI